MAEVKYRKLRILAIDGPGGWPFDAPKIVDVETGQEVNLGPIQEVNINFKIGEFAMVTLTVPMQVNVAVGADAEGPIGKLMGNGPFPLAIAQSEPQVARVLYPCGCVSSPYNSKSPLPDYCPEHGAR